MVANSRKKHWGQILGPFDITANDKDRVGADVAGNQESINFSRHYAGI